MGVVTEKRKQVTPAHIEHRTGRNNRAEPDLLREAPVEDGGQQRAALTEERNGPRLCDILRECGIESGQGIHQAQTIRSNQPRCTLFQFFLNCLLRVRRPQYLFP